MASPPQEWNSPVDQSLLEAVENDMDSSTIEDILYGDHYVNINTVNLKKETPLHIATQKNNISVVNTLLINHNTVPNVQNAYGDTPLHIAIRLGYIQIAKRLLLDWRTNPYLVNKNKETILHLVIGKRRLELYDLIKKDELSRKDILGFTAFMYAVLQYHQTSDPEYIRIIVNLLDHGARVEIPDIMDDIGDTWKHFIDHPNFQLDSEIQTDRTIFGYCCIRGDNELLEYIRNKKEIIMDQYETNLFIAIRNHHIQTAITLLTMDVEYNKKKMNDLTKQLFFLNLSDEDQLTVIMDVLFATGRITSDEVVQYSLIYYRPILFKKFISKEIVDTLLINNQSVVVVCCLIFPELFNYLIEHFFIGNDMIDIRGNTILNLAVQQSLYSGQIIRTLLKNGCDPNRVNDAGKKPIDYALCFQTREIIRILLPVSKITPEECISLLTSYSRVPTNIIVPLLDFNWIEMIKTMKIGAYRKVLYFIMDISESHKRELLFYMIGKENRYQIYLDLVTKIKNITLENSHNIVDIWTMEIMESDDIIQYGEPIQGKYKTLTIASIIEMIRQAEDYVSLGYIKDPFDRSVIHEQTSYNTGYPVFMEVLIRKLLE